MALRHDLRVLIGGFTDVDSGSAPRGLAVQRVGADGSVSHEGSLELENPTWITPSHDPMRYYVSHSARRQLSLVELGTGGALSLVDQIDIGATNPAHVSLSGDRRHVIASCFTEGVVVEVAVNPDGTFTSVERTWDANRAMASATRRNRLQSDAEPHQSVPFAGGALVPDRAQDVVWRIDANSNLTPAAVVRPGAGPRHLALHPDAPVAYLVGELDSTLITFRSEGEALTPIDVRTTLPSDWFGDSAAAGITVDAARGRLYLSNRGHDSVAVFDIAHPEQPRLLDWLPAGGRTPRFIGLLAGVDALAIATQDSDRVDLLSAEDAARITGERISLRHTAPTCVVAVQG